MNILDDVNYEIAILRSNITDTYNASAEASARADFVAAALMLDAAEDVQLELRAALDFRADLLGETECDTCDGDQCSNCYYDVSVSVDPTDMDQSYQLDVLLNELNTMGAQIEHMQGEIDNLDDALYCADDSIEDAYSAVDYWAGEAVRQEMAADDVVSVLEEIYDIASCRVSNICSVENRLNAIFRLAERTL